MGRRRKTHKHLPHHIYRARGKYQLRRRDRTTRLYATLDEALLAWAREWGEDEGSNLQDVANDYIASVLPSKAERTQSDYLIAIKRLMAVFGHMRPASIKPHHIYTYMDKRQATVQANRDVAVLSNLFGHAIRKGLIDLNPCRQVRRIPEKPRTRYVTDGEFWKAHDMAPAEVQRAMKLALVTGMRLGDILAGQAHTDEGLMIEQAKTGRRLLLEWTDDLRELAQPFSVTKSGFQSAWQRLMRKVEKAGMDRFTFHDLRAKAGSDAKDWRLLGHTDRATFERIYNRAPVRIVNRSPVVNRRKGDK